jgi:rhodanese-related sulfurtransferase
MAAILVIAAAILLLMPKSTLPAEVDVVRAHEMYEQGALFVDVRTQEEWDQGHIARSVLIPLDELPSQLSDLPQDQDIVVVCKLGGRSKEGATILRQAGFRRVTCMSGGIQAWIAAGYAVEQ